jgi:imidazolonepropionase-like amidohydrolase
MSLLPLLVTALGTQNPSAPPPGSVAITGVTVIDVETGGHQAGRTVIITGNRITSVSPAGSATIPAGARVLEGRGGFLIPGLWDFHVHAAFNGMDRLFMPLLVANGVTGVRDMWSRLDWMDSSRARIRAGVFAGPRLIGSGNLVDGVPQIWPGSLGASTPEDGRRIVDSLARAGAGFIKVYSRLSPEVYRAIAAEAKRIGISFAGHVPGLVSPAEASDLGQRTIEHLTTIILGCSADEDRLRAQTAAAVAAKGWDSAGALQRRGVAAVLEAFDADRCRELARRFVRNGTWMSPTITVLRSTAFLDDTTLAADPRMAFIPEAFGAGWNPNRDFRFRTLTAEDWARRKDVFRRQLEVIRLLKAEGVRFLAGTDLSNPYIFPGFSLHDELANLVEAGFSPLDALRAATIEPARFLGATDSLGAVAQGQLADLVLLDADPLADIRNISRIRAVVADGRVYDQGAIAELLARGREIARPPKQ